MTSYDDSKIKLRESLRKARDISEREWNLYKRYQLKYATRQISNELKELTEDQHENYRYLRQLYSQDPYIVRFLNHIAKTLDENQTIAKESQHATAESDKRNYKLTMILIFIAVVQTIGLIAEPSEIRELFVKSRKHVIASLNFETPSERISRVNVHNRIAVRTDDDCDTRTALVSKANGEIDLSIDDNARCRKLPLKTCFRKYWRQQFQTPCAKHQLE